MDARSRITVALMFLSGFAAGEVTKPVSGWSQARTHQAQSVRSLLSRLIPPTRGQFLLTGTENQTRGGPCNFVVTASAIESDYMVVKQGRLEFIVPFAAIYRIDPEGPGSVTIPVIYLTAFPQLHACGD